MSSPVEKIKASPHNKLSPKITSNHPLVRVDRILDILSRDRARITLAQGRLLLYVALHPGVNQADAAKWMGTSQSMSGRTLITLMAEGMVARSGEAGPTSSYAYSLTRKGQLLVESIEAEMKEVKDTREPEELKP